MQDPSQLAASQPGGGPLVFGPPVALPGYSTRCQPSNPMCRRDRQRESHFHPPVHQSSAPLPCREVFLFVCASVSIGTRRLRMRSRFWTLNLAGPLPCRYSRIGKGALATWNATGNKIGISFVLLSAYRLKLQNRSCTRIYLYTARHCTTIIFFTATSKRYL